MTLSLADLCLWDVRASRSLLGLTDNRKQHLGSAVDALTAFHWTTSRRRLRLPMLAERVHEVDHVLRPRCDTLT